VTPLAPATLEPEADVGTRRVDVAFLWHLHQPDYRDPVGCGDMALPWVRLHATRGYTDLAAVLEAHPEVRSTVNLTPVLVDQIDDYARGLRGDRHLTLSERPAADLSLEDRMEILRGFFAVDWETGVRPLPRYWALLHKRGRDLKTIDLERAAHEFTDAELRDLQVLWNLAWMGFHARATEDVVKNLLAKGEGFTEIEKKVLLECQERVVAEVLPRWKRLASEGIVELTTTPYYHPILPLLVDTDAARRAMPQASLPPRSTRPADAELQLARALDAHEKRFGKRPDGVWPAEGSVSPEVLELFAKHGVRFSASDEEVLLRSESDRPLARTDLYQPFRVDAGEGSVDMVFRDRQLADLIGFSYAQNPAAQAVDDLTGRIAAIGNAAPAGTVPLVSIILDGENPWLRYPASGEAFLGRLHEVLSRGKLDGVELHSTGIGAAITEHPPVRRLTRIHSGSWIEASYRIWIGHEETNLAWQLLSQAGRALDTGGAQLARENRDEALEHLLVAEGSDWFWWYGDDFVADDPEVFDALFRSHLSKVYELTGQATPPRLRVPISEAALGVLGATPLREPTSLVTPVIDGTAAPYVDWAGAGVYRPARGSGAMFQASVVVGALYYGIDQTEIFLRMDPTTEGAHKDEIGTVVVELVQGERTISLEAPLMRDEDVAALYEGEPIGRVCFGDIVEMSIPFERLGLDRGERVRVAVHIRSEAVEIERLPRYGHLTLRVPARDVGQRSYKA